MFNTYRLTALAAALFAITAFAQEERPPTEDSNASWLENTIARCEQQYSAEQCRDQQFLEDNFHVGSLQTAHRVATQRNQQATKALRELTLQRVCNTSPSSSCTGADAAQCSVEISQACAVLKAEAAACIQNAKTLCVSSVDPSACVKQQSALCPAADKQPLDKLLAKYPKLTAQQKSRLIAAAAELDAKSSGWWNLVGWLKSPFY
ncbi:MAG TPA: hypothetical protein VGK97_12465 [Spongiibacteraceae bacterium]